MIYNKKQATNLLGLLMNDTSNIHNKDYNLSVDDFVDNIHKIIFGAIQNLVLGNDVKNLDGLAIDTYLSQFTKQHVIFTTGGGIDYIENIKILSQNSSMKYTYETVKKYSLLRELYKCGIDVSKYYNTNALDLEGNISAQNNLESESLEEILNYFSLKFNEVKSQFSQGVSNAERYDVADGIDELLQSCQTDPLWGLPYSSKYLNTITRGIMTQKVVIRSGDSGSGKSRLAMEDCVNLSCSEKFNVKTNQWESRNTKQNVLFISTELILREIQLCLLAIVSGVREATIKNGAWTEDETIRLKKASMILKEAKLYTVYMDDYSIPDLELLIEEYVISKQVKYVFFDYIQIVGKLSSELAKQYGYVLREDQMLAAQTQTLKAIANKYDIFIGSSTQLNRNFKVDDRPDSTHLAGGKATINKADVGIICLEATEKHLQAIRPIVETRMCDMPTHVWCVFKNRGGSHNMVMVWVNVDLDTVSINDCFVTNYNYELKDIEATSIEIA